MRVGLFVRTDQATKPGGDLVQAESYANALRRAGTQAQVIGRAQELPSLDILHVFNYDRPWDCLPLARRAKELGCTVVLSPIAHPRESVRRYQAQRSFWWERLLSRAGAPAGLSERLKAVARGATTRSPGVLAAALGSGLPAAASELWALSTGIQLLSLAERGELERQGCAFAGKVAVLIRNGIDPAGQGSGLSSEQLVRFIGIHPRYAVVGGRVEPRKNQIEVLRAAQSLGIPIVFVGHLNHRHGGYCREFLQAVGEYESACYAGGLPRAEFAQVLRQAHVHVSASLFEVSPLVDLEALACGCRVVATRASLGTEYLDDQAELCDPWSSDSIRGALQRTWTRPERGTPMAVPAWEDTAAPLLELYHAARAAGNQ